VLCVVSAAVLQLLLASWLEFSTHSVVMQFTACKHGYVGCSVSKVCLQLVGVYPGPLCVVAAQLHVVFVCCACAFDKRLCRRKL
jgi:hypothetical protein